MTVKPGWTLLIVAVWLSALVVIFASHQTRQLHAERNQLAREYDQLLVQWGRLTLEQGALSAPMLLEQYAEQLDMRSPGTGDIELLPEVPR